MAVNVDEKLTRGQRLWESARLARDTTISLSRAKLLTESYKETEGLPLFIRRAKAFENIVAKMPIFIDDEQLLVGDFGAWSGAAEWFPEHSITWERREFRSGHMPYGLDDLEIQEFKEILDYWEDKNFRDSFIKTIGEDEANRLDDVAEEGACAYSMFIEMNSDKGWYCPNYEKALSKGFAGIIEDIVDEQRELHIVDTFSYQKKHFLEAIKMELTAGIDYSRRYAQLAANLAKECPAERKEELETIAEICSWIPEYPARTFYEALQMVWFIHLMGWFDSSSNGVALGRVDQYLFPFYKRDVEKGILNKASATALLECLRVKMNAKRDFASIYSHHNSSGEVQFHNCTLGGQTVNGDDATNELSFLWLEAAFNVRNPHPTLSIRYHENLDPDFALRAAQLTSLGLGYPAWFGDKSTIQYLIGPNMGATPEEAMDYQLSGCVITTISNKTAATWPIQLNMGKILELALYDGFDFTTGKQIGPNTGRFENMSAWEELYESYKTQLAYFMKESAVYLNLLRLHRAQLVPQIFRSALFDDCIKRGQNPLDGGCVYQGSSMYLLPIGVMDAVDSLAAIRKAVFDEKKITSGALLEALAANFDGYEDTRKLLLKAPKFGNDDDYADVIAANLYQYLIEMCSKTEACFGAKYVCAPHSLRFHSSFGRKVGALPNGRLAGYSLSEGAVSPCQGADMKGPTAIINSAAKIDQIPIFGTLFNMKFHPSALSSDEDLLKLISLIGTYFDEHNGKHIQFNVVDKDTLLDAQAHPENYQNLVVRVAGYSALWVELERTIQDEIIARSEKSW